MKFRTAFDMWLFGKCLEREMNKISRQQIVIEIPVVNQGAENVPVEQEKTATKSMREIEISADYSDADRGMTFCFIFLGGTLVVIIGSCMQTFLGMDTKSAIDWSFCIGSIINCWLWIKFRRHYYSEQKCKFTDKPPICITLFIFFMAIMFGRN